MPINYNDKCPNLAIYIPQIFFGKQIVKKNNN